MACFPPDGQFQYKGTGCLLNGDSAHVAVAVTPPPESEHYATPLFLSVTATLVPTFRAGKTIWFSVRVCAVGGDGGCAMSMPVKWSSVFRRRSCRRLDRRRSLAGFPAGRLLQSCDQTDYGDPNPNSKHTGTPLLSAESDLSHQSLLAVPGFQRRRPFQATCPT